MVTTSFSPDSDNRVRKGDVHLLVTMVI